MADYTLDLNNLIKGDGAKMTLDEIIGSLEKLNNVYSVMISQAQGKAEEFAKGLETISKAADQLEDSFKKLDISAKKDQDTLSKGAQELEGMVKQSDDYTDALANTKKQIDTLTTSQESLSESQAKLNKQQEAGVGSLADLRAQLSAATKEYTNLIAEERKTAGPEVIDRIKKLSSEIKVQDDALKNAKKGVEAARGSYNSLSQQVAAAKKALKDMEGGIGSETEEFKKLQSFIASGTKQLKEFDEAIGDNQRDVGNYKKAVEDLGQLGFGSVISQVKETGKQLVILAGNPFFLIVIGLIAAFKLATAAVKTFFDTTGEGEDIFEREALKVEAFFGAIQKNVAEVGKDIVEFFGGVEKIAPVIGRAIIVALGPLGALLIKPFEEANAKLQEQVPEIEQFAEDIDRLGEKMLTNLIERAQSELDVNKLLEKSKNTLLYTDEQRLDFLKKAGKENERQAKREIELTTEAYAQEVKRIHLATNDPTDAQKEKVAELAAKIIQLNADYFGQQKRNTAAVVALTQEIEKRKREAAERTLDTQREIDKAILSDEIATQKKILDEETSTLEQRTQALIASNDARLQILAQDKQHEVDLVTRAAEERIRAEGKNVTDELLLNDEGYLNSLRIIMHKYENLVEDSNEKTKEAVKESFFTVLARQAHIATAEIQEALDNQLEALNNQLNLGQIGLHEYEDDKKRIQANGQRVALTSQLEFLKKELTNTKDNSEAKAELLAKIAKVELDLSQITTNGTIDDLKRLEAAQKQLAANIQQIQVEAFQFAQALVDASVQRNIESLEAQLTREEENKDKRLKIVGDDKQAQALIELDFANKQKAIEEQIAAQKRKSAIFEKALNISQIISNTATAIMKTLAAGGFLALPLSVTIGAIGALQLGRALATPIPAFYTGTDYSPEGRAWVGDRYGRELSIGPDGKMTMYDRPQIAHLKEGTRIFSNKHTEQIADLMDIEGNIRGNNRDAMLLGDSKTLLMMDNSEVVSSLRAMKEQLVDAIKSQPQDYYDEAGYRRYERTRNGRVQRLDDKYRFKR